MIGLTLLKIRARWLWLLLAELTIVAARTVVSVVSYAEVKGRKRSPFIWRNCYGTALILPTSCHPIILNRLHHPLLRELIWGHLHWLPWRRLLRIVAKERMQFRYEGRCPSLQRLFWIGGCKLCIRFVCCILPSYLSELKIRQGSFITSQKKYTQYYTQCR